MSCVSCDCECTNITGISDADSVNSRFEDYDSSDMYFRVCASCIADEEDLLCKYKDEIKWPILYMMGIMIMKDIRQSTQVNPVIQNTQDSALENLVAWLGGEDSAGVMRKGEYRESIEKGIENIKHSLSNIRSKAIRHSATRIARVLP